jgi:hypothetical protein
MDRSLVEAEAKLRSGFGQIAFPLFTVEFNRVVPLGTAFFVLHDGTHYIVSAAHVLEIYKTQSIAYYVEGSDYEEPKGLIFTDQVNFGDVGLLEIQGRVRLPAGCRPLTLDAFGPPTTELELGMPLACGFPCSKNKPDASKLQIRSTILLLFGNGIPTTDYLKTGHSPDRHTLMTFDPKQCSSPDGTARVPPALNGMSGGPIFWLPKPIAPPSPNELRVIGIVSSRKPRNRLLVGESWRLVAGYVEALSWIRRISAKDDQSAKNQTRSRPCTPK